MTSELKTTGASIMCLHDLLLDDQHFDFHAIDGTLLFVLFCCLLSPFVAI